MTSAQFAAKQSQPFWHYVLLTQSENFLVGGNYIYKLNVLVEKEVELRDRVALWRNRKEDGNIILAMEPTLTRFRLKL